MDACPLPLPPVPHGAPHCPSAPHALTQTQIRYKREEYWFQQHFLHSLFLIKIVVTRNVNMLNLKRSESHNFIKLGLPLLRF